MLGLSRSSLFPVNFGDLIWHELNGLSNDQTRRSPLQYFNVDIEDTGEHLLVTADLPGMTSEDIKIAVENGILTITGNRESNQEQKGDNFYLCERVCGDFSRNFKIPVDVDESNIDASLSDGVLSIILPRKEETKPRKIEIKT